MFYRRRKLLQALSFGCALALQPQLSAARADEAPAPAPVSAEDERALPDTQLPAIRPFIKHGPNGWVLATPPQHASGTDVCKILGREYGCFAREKEKFGKELAEVERVLLNGFN